MTAAVCPGMDVSCPWLHRSVTGARFRTTSAKRTLGPKNAKPTFRDIGAP